MDYHIIPNHIGIIPDGHRRWARQHNLTFAQTYEIAGQRLAQWIVFCFQKGFTSVSIYPFTRENLKRSPEDLAPLYRGGVKFCTEYLPPIKEKWHAEVYHAGKHGLVVPELQEAIDAICTDRSDTYICRTQSQAQYKIYLLVGYHPLDEINTALSKTPENEDFWNYLWVPDTVDIVVRTSGVIVLSNFLPIQTGNARIYCIEEMFPDTNFEQLEGILSHFSTIDRPFGK